MAGRRITVEFGQTYNTGNYESLRLGASMEEDIVESDNVKEVMRTRMLGLRSFINKMAKEIIELDK